jgi:hypothetical protein
MSVNLKALLYLFHNEISIQWIYNVLSSRISSGVNPIREKNTNRSIYHKLRPREFASHLVIFSCDIVSIYRIAPYKHSTTKAIAYIYIYIYIYKKKRRRKEREKNALEIRNGE